MEVEKWELEKKIMLSKIPHAEATEESGENE